MNAIASASASALPSIVATRLALAGAVEIAARVVEKRNTYPILANLRLRGDGSHLFITATDLDIYIDVRVDGAADESFDVTMPADLLKALLKGAPKSAEYAAITAPEWPALKPGEKRQTAAAVLDMEEVKTTLACLHPESFPTDLKATFSHRFAMSGADLLASLDAVAFAISNEAVRYYLNGIYWHVAKRREFVGSPSNSPEDVARGWREVSRLRMVATDGHRMARHDAAIAPDGANGMPGVIIPQKTVTILQKLMAGKKCPDSVEVEVGERHVRFMFGAVTITSKVIEGTFPDYERVTPKNNDKALRVESAGLIDAVKRVSAIASERGGKAVKLTANQSMLTLSVSNPDHGEASCDVAAESDLEHFEIGFNARYLTDILAHLPGHAELMFNDAGSPTLIRRSADADTLYVLMPMRV